MSARDLDIAPYHSKSFLSCIFATCCMFFMGCTNRNAPAPVTELYQGKTYKDFKADSFNGNSYIVQKGDTLFSIAWFSGNDYRDLARINNIEKPFHIYPGQTLQLKPSSQKTKGNASPETGQTSKTIVNQAVDPSKKQAYGESEQNINKDSFESSVGKFPSRIKSWTWPTSKVVTRGFSKRDEGNKGLDFEGQLGTPILAAADGKVVYTGNALRGFGNLVIIKHSEAYLTAYAHNDQILVKERQWVKQGQKVATMGRSGTDKVKLHFEVRYKGKSVNPLRYLPKR